MSREPKKTIDRKLNIASLPSPAGNKNKSSRVHCHEEAIDREEQSQ
jgi:hypothetical protein